MLILLRHGRTPANAAGLLQGRLDQDLDDHGVLQAKTAARYIEERYGVDAVVSSPLKRARQTASMFGREVTIDERWIELAYGVYEGTPFTGVSSEAWQRWRDDPSVALEGGESLTVLADRVRDACEEIVERASEENIVVVSHVSPIKSTVAWALDVDIGISFHSHLDQAAVCRVEFRNGHPILASFNEVAPLDE